MPGHIRRGLVIAQFQPYTNAHRSFIERAAADADELIVGIGSAQISHTLLQPFTAGERVLMLSRDLRNLGIPVYVIPIEDIKENSLFVSHIRSMTPPFEVVYTSNVALRQLFLEAGVQVVFPSDVCHGGRVVKADWLRSVSIDDGWERDVPAAAAEVMREVHAQDRIAGILHKYE